MADQTSQTMYDIILKRRSIRKFQDKPVPYEVLEKCVNAARLAPSAMNLQPCEYVIIDEEPLLTGLFKSIKWAGYVKNYQHNPAERPKAYMIILVNRNIRGEGYEYDVGLAAANVIYTAYENDLGCCLIRAADMEKVRAMVNAPENHDPVMIIALGYPAEQPVSEDVKNNVRYWVDDKNVLHVPKRKLSDVLHRNGF
jgi:nitroreductase